MDSSVEDRGDNDSSDQQVPDNLNPSLSCRRVKPAFADSGYYSWDYKLSLIDFFSYRLEPGIREIRWYPALNTIHLRNCRRIIHD